MPVILDKRENERKWLSYELKREDIDTLLLPCSDENMVAHTVSRIIKDGREKNTPMAQEKFTYHELTTEQKVLF